MKLKPNEGAFTTSGKQTVPRHRVRLPLRKASLSTDFRLAKLVRTASSKFHGRYSLTCAGPLSSFAGQRRPPLPPQQSLYKESMNSHVREPAPVQLPEKNDPPRQNGHGPDPAGRLRNSEPQPPSGPGGRRGHSRKSQRTEPMDVDPPASVHPPRMQESRSTLNAISDRDDTKGDLPRGPKAMTSKIPPVPPTVLPPKPATLSERYPGRSPPPHLIERPPQRTGDQPVVDPHSDRQRDTPRERRNSETAPSRRRSPDSVGPPDLQHGVPDSRFPKWRPPTEPAPTLKLSGTNSVPIARSRYQTATTPIPEGTDEPQQDHVSESKQLLPNTLTRQARHERSAFLERVSDCVSVYSPISENLSSVGAKKYA